MASIVYVGTSNTASPATYKDLADAQYVQREILKTTVADTVDFAPFLTMLTLGDKGRTSKSKKPEWIVGDSEPVRTTLTTADINVSDTTKGASTSAMTLAITSVPINSILRIYDSHAGEQLVCIYKGQGQAATVLYASGIASPLVRHASSTVYIGSTAMPYDGEAGLGVNYGGIFYNNAIQQIRESVELGPNTESDAVYMKRDMAEMARIKYIGLQQKLENMLMNVPVKAAAEASFTDTGIMGGIDYFNRPWDTTLAGMVDTSGATNSAANASASALTRGTGIRGWTRIISGTTIDDDTCTALAADWRKYGSKDRHIFGPSTVIQKFIKMAKAMNILTTVDYRFPNFPDVIARIPAFDTGFGMIYLHVDYSMDGVYKYVTDGTNYIHGTNWCYVLDMEQFEKITLVSDIGTHNLRFNPLDVSQNGNTIKKGEWLGAWTYANLEPRASGTIIFGTPVAL